MSKCLRDELDRLKQNFTRVRPVLQRMVNNPTAVSVEEITNFIIVNQLFFGDVSLYDSNDWTQKEKDLYFFFHFKYKPLVSALYFGGDINEIMTSSEEKKQRILFTRNILVMEKLILKLMKAGNLLMEYNPAK